ncbi:MAG: hypothetical protein II445_00325, partial [Muribaculaceae bacterium]|nr:hypothetical protein [Muribaculaceae bacterium]
NQRTATLKSPLASVFNLNKVSRHLRGYLLCRFLSACCSAIGLTNMQKSKFFDDFLATIVKNVYFRGLKMKIRK